MTDCVMLENAPIKEAIIHISIEPLGSPITQETIDSLTDTLAGEYGEFKAGYRSTMNLALDDATVKQTHSQSFFGYRAESKENRYVAQFMVDAFALSKLEPYDSWQPFSLEAQRLWAIYKSILPPFRVTRVAVRYINEILIPLKDGFIRFGDYLTAPPEIPAALGEMVTEFFSRIAVPFPEERASAIITQAFNNVRDGCAPILLDIDISRTHLGDLSDKELWFIFEELRNLKNRIFNESVTDKVRELCK